MRSGLLIALAVAALGCSRDRPTGETKPKSDPATTVTSAVATASNSDAREPPSAPSSSASTSAIAQPKPLRPGCDVVQPAADLCDGVTRLLAGMKGAFEGMRCPKDLSALAPSDFDECMLYTGTKKTSFDRAFTCNAIVPIASRDAEAARRVASLTACLGATWKRIGEAWFVEPELECELTSGDEGPEETGKASTRAWIRLQCRHTPASVDAGADAAPAASASSSAEVD